MNKVEAKIIAKLADVPVLFIEDFKLKFFFDDMEFDALVLINAFLFKSNNNIYRKSPLNITLHSELIKMINSAEFDIDHILDQINKYHYDPQ